MRSLRGLLEPRNQVLAGRDEVERAAKLEYRPIGWLARTAKGWTLVSGAAVPAQRELWAVVLGEDKRGGWRQVGAIAGGKPAIDAPDASALAEGRPVFVMTSLR